ncbi:MAG: DEAD/DEAH box helicase [Polyangiales bacterium]
MSAFQRFHPNLRHAIVHDLGWRSLRPVQERAAEAILDGDNAVVLAPTAGGKTEASVFPVLSRILTEGIGPVAALYVCPIRALLNNQEERIGRYARMVGLESFKWHGDVAASSKDRARRAPAHLLLTTPESIEVMLISEKTDARRLFEGLSTVIVDEVHAFAGDQRGAHLVSLLERLTRFCGRDVQRIGLSATVGNPGEIGRWLQGSSRRAFRLVDPPKEPTPREMRVDRVPDVDAAAEEAARIGRFKKSLVFVESRSQAERVAAAMAGRGTEVFVHHSAISRADRARAEEQFATGRNTAIVCTATMELGIDVGDLDHVIQVDAPSTVSALLQRMGRTGRRPGTRSNCTFLCASPEAVVQAAAMTRLVERGWVRRPPTPRASHHVLAHQILALTLQEGGVSRHRIRGWLDGAAGFADVDEATLGRGRRDGVARDPVRERRAPLAGVARREAVRGEALLRALRGLLPRRGCCAWFTAAPTSGRAGDLPQRPARREAGAVLPARGPGVVGGPDGLVARRLRGGAGDGGARAVVARHAAGAVVGGLPGGEGGAPRRREVATLTRPARQCLDELREGYEGLVEPGAAPFEVADDGVTWHTFAGATINRTLAAGLRVLSGRGEWAAGNLSVRATTPLSAAEVSALANRLRSEDWGERAEREVLDGATGPGSKFDVCLPDPLREDTLRRGGS